jgi:hypothetical protein
MSVIAMPRPFVPGYVPSLDRAVGLTAAALNNPASETATSWTAARDERAEKRVLAAVLDAAQHGIVTTDIAQTVARSFAQLLPSHVPIPTIEVEEDGEIAFDWNEATDRGMTVAVTANGYLGYSALVGLTPDYGRAPFPGSIPETVLFNLLRVYPVPAAPRRR